MNTEEIREGAAAWMINRGWKMLIAKRRVCIYTEQSRRIYPEPGRREQSLFEHTIVELDALLSLLPILKQPNHFHLTEEENKILFASVIACDVGMVNIKNILKD